MAADMLDLFQWYADMDHGLGGSATQHVYTHISRFLHKCLARPQ